jgi:hypothetical protein
VGKDCGLYDDNYLEFLKARSKIIVEEIERLTGRTTAPAPDQRQKTIERLESQLRDLIHGTLTDAHGQNYWSTAVAEDVRSEAETKIAAALKKQPELTAHHFDDTRRKIDYCNVADYLKLIQMRSNWPNFERVFRSKEDVQRHLKCFSEFRNALMHGRALTELTRRDGETAMIWLETVMLSDEEEDDNVELNVDND